NGEYYIGPLYNVMVAQGQTVRGIEVDQFICFGTPEDLAVSESLAVNAESLSRLADRTAVKKDRVEP
ncbi:MAG TPA: hypothetical protein VF205_03940, partial [Nitrospiraceae bacterium]